jgi:hypothetical protein
MPSMALIHNLLNVFDGEVNGSVSSVSAKLAAAIYDCLESHARKIFYLAGIISQRAVGKLD